jgi:hypothetical protein
VGGTRWPVYRRSELGQPILGPALIEEATATVLVPAGFRATSTPIGLSLQNGHRRI